ncbi:exodeoxyribonuclease VII large subunit [Paenibacillus thermoaerophilus]|uniref:Exodeoxyribonuclease 7 large subunit n=1 Tax=Paenibacillus thermoaerophilus TaxID=1215385 RepID=A0ABW2V2K9_9BACL|nr:exodeoxyribonuclease VII large subunit [Paenibacillus thermoaerophilus]TMV18779.1 exodeoxyribonuclease VII large subunit [Paenibacillus thermoaerophilus]
MSGTASALTVKELTRYIKLKLEGDPRLADVWVKGEISNFTRHTSGHLYFTLKDADSRIKCIQFASNASRLAFAPREGMKVLARGSVSIYERDGQYQFYVREMQPDGLGSLYLAFEQLKSKLAAEGLFDPSRKRPIPRFPSAIGVVTSPTGAAIRDILTTLGRRYPQVRVVLFPVLVQGEQAAPSIARAIEVLNRLGEVDVMIVGRGGGSLEELWAFNEELVARAIAASSIPVISAVGHETDFTIADFVADLRAATPTAAAELAVPHVLELKAQLSQFRRRLEQGLIGRLRGERERLARLARSPALTQPHRLLRQPAERLDRLRERMAYRLAERSARSRERLLRLSRRLAGQTPEGRAALHRSRIRELEHRLQTAAAAAVKEKRAAWLSSLRHLDALSPLKVMQRGYAIAYDEKERTLINSVRQVQLGDILKIRLTDGKLDCHVWKLEEWEHGEAEGRQDA